MKHPKGAMITPYSSDLPLPLAVKGEKGSSDRAQEAQKAIQEATQRERQMYEGIQKGAQSLEKNLQERRNKARSRKRLFLVTIER